jgi:type VI secretion system protein ImpC
VRDKIGSFRERDDMERFLSDWIQLYVLGNPEVASQTARATRPLAAAEVKVESIEGNPGYYGARFYLRPHYQLEGLHVTLSLVSRLPSEKST